MPTSYAESIPTVVDIIQQVKPKKVLDIGIGRGKYGLLTREYCDEVIVDGVEAWPEYITDIQRAIYRNIFTEDIVKMDLSKLEDYDLVLMIDVIEHLTKEDGMRIINSLKTQFIISTPIEDYRAHYDNHFEDHISHWTTEDFSQYPFVDCSTKLSTIVLLDARDDSKK